MECFILPAAGRTVNLVGLIFLHGHSGMGINDLLWFSSTDLSIRIKFYILAAGPSVLPAVACERPSHKYTASHSHLILLAPREVRRAQRG